MPRFEKGSDEAREYMRMIREKKGRSKGPIVREMPMEGGKIKMPKIKVNKSLVRNLITPIKQIGTAAGKPYSASGINPFQLGYDIGFNVIGPALAGKGMFYNDIDPAISGKGMKGRYRNMKGGACCSMCGGAIVVKTF